MATGIEDVDLRGEKGWVCPTCGKSLSPSVIVCPFCVSSPVQIPKMPPYIPYVDNTDLGRPECCRGCSNWPGPCWCSKPSMVTSSGTYQWNGGGAVSVSYGGVSTETLGQFQILS